MADDQDKSESVQRARTGAHLEATSLQAGEFLRREGATKLHGSNCLVDRVEGLVIGHRLLSSYSAFAVVADGPRLLTRTGRILGAATGRGTAC